MSAIIHRRGPPWPGIMGNTYVLNQGTLVLEGVTLAAVVQLVVEVLVDLAAGTVLDQKTAEDSEAAHPEDLAGHTGIGGTLALTVATVSALSSSEVQLAGARSRVLGDGLSDDEAIGDELSDGLARVGVGDLALLVGVEPDLALAAADDRRGQALLSSQIDPAVEEETRVSHQLPLISMMDFWLRDRGDGIRSIRSQRSPASSSPNIASSLC